MNEYYADFHIHIGRTKSGKAVKITGSKTLTLKNILQAASDRKGLDLIGIIDCHSPEVLDEIKELISSGEMTELSQGGLRYRSVTLIPGAEIEVYDEHCHGPIHVLAYFPTFETMKSFSEWMSGYVKNMTLSRSAFIVMASPCKRRFIHVEACLFRLMCLHHLRVFMEKELLRA